MDTIKTKTHHHHHQQQQQAIAITKAFDNLAKAASHVKLIFYLLFKLNISHLLI
jgi:hypothetical protein